MNKSFPVEAVEAQTISSATALHTEQDAIFHSIPINSALVYHTGKCGEAKHRGSNNASHPEALGSNLIAPKVLREFFSAVL